MDDLLLSLHSVEDAIQLYKEITEILSQAGFTLRKWASNNMSVLDYISKQDQSKDKLLIAEHDENELKTLGILWNPALDCLRFLINIALPDKQITKRIALSTISQIYDPLGLISPVVIRAKLFMQELFKLGIDWDQPIPEEEVKLFFEFFSQFHVLNEIIIKRQVLTRSPVKVRLCGFADASERAYGACLYLVSENQDGTLHSQLLCAKTKVSPIRKVTLPRAELLAAHLLAKLVNTVVREILDIEISEISLFSDSTIVLSWLKIDPSRLKTFVANRVAQINELTDITDWKHVKSEDNAADVISRGIDPKELVNLNAWWYGPPFLTNKVDKIAFESIPFENLPEIKSSTIVLVNTDIYKFDSFQKFSSFRKLQCVMCYVLRFINRLFKRRYYNSNVLSTDELKEAHDMLIKIAQVNSFSAEINALKHSNRLRGDSRILNLHPFLDQHSLLRVGGRLSNSDLSYEQKHPLILPDKHKITELITKSQHIKNLHAVVQTLLSIMRLEYWPINGKNVVKGVIRSCVRCFKLNPKPRDNLMGALPKARVTQPLRAFAQCGIDYAGPIFIKENTLRNSRAVKTYLCIFVCFAVKAVHIELVKDLSTNSFLNALKRFISRRGKPSDIFSDNGSNFIGANNHFRQLYDLISSQSHNDNVSQFLAKEQIYWHFNPANSPHMGGLWESAVKSTKFHLRRVLGTAAVSYEEMYTLLTQIEACLNSRPLIPISNDPTDLLPLTPSHFIIGDSLKALPQLNLLDVNEGRLSRYDRLQQLLQQFWKRWSRDYLSQLQTRNKWKTVNNNPVMAGSLVVLKEDNTSPLHWPMARIVALHPGVDGITRVVSVRTASGKVLKRTISKLCVLPVD